MPLDEKIKNFYVNLKESVKKEKDYFLPAIAYTSMLVFDVFITVFNRT